MTKQKKVLVCGLFVFALCGMFPPWLDSYGNTEGYHFLLTPDLDKLDSTRLGVEWLCVAALTGAAWLLTATPATGEQTKRDTT